MRIINKDSLLQHLEPINKVKPIPKYIIDTILIEPEIDTHNHAHWVVKSINEDYIVYYCSNCKREIKIDNEYGIDCELLNYPYCNCGCKMFEVNK